MKMKMKMNIRRTYIEEDRRCRFGDDDMIYDIGREGLIGRLGIWYC